MVDDDNDGNNFCEKKNFLTISPPSIQGLGTTNKKKMNLKSSF